MPHGNRDGDEERGAGTEQRESDRWLQSGRAETDSPPDWGKNCGRDREPQEREGRRLEIVGNSAASSDDPGGPDDDSSDRRKDADCTRAMGRAKVAVEAYA